MLCKFKTKDVLFKSVILDVIVLCFSLGGQASKLCRQCFDVPISEWTGILSIALSIAKERQKLTQSEAAVIEHAQELLNSLNYLPDNIFPAELSIKEGMSARCVNKIENSNTLAYEIYKLNKLLETCREMR